MEMISGRRGSAEVLGPASTVLNWVILYGVGIYQLRFRTQQSEEMVDPLFIQKSDRYTSKVDNNNNPASQRNIQSSKILKNPDGMEKMQQPKSKKKNRKMLLHLNRIPQQPGRMLERAAEESFIFRASRSSLMFSHFPPR